VLDKICYCASLSSQERVMGIVVIAHSDFNFFVIVSYSNKNLNVENSHIICNSIPNLKLSGNEIGGIAPTCTKPMGPMFLTYVVPKIFPNFQKN